MFVATNCCRLAHDGDFLKDKDNSILKTNHTDKKLAGPQVVRTFTLKFKIGMQCLSHALGFNVVIWHG